MKARTSPQALRAGVQVTRAWRSHARGWWKLQVDSVAVTSWPWSVGRPWVPRRGFEFWDRAATGRGRPVQDRRGPITLPWVTNEQVSSQELW